MKATYLLVTVKRDCRKKRQLSSVAATGWVIFNHEVSYCSMRHKKNYVSPPEFSTSQHAELTVYIMDITQKSLIKHDPNLLIFKQNKSSADHARVLQMMKRQVTTGSFKEQKKRYLLKE